MFTVLPPPTAPSEAKTSDAVPPLPGESLMVPEPSVGVSTPRVSTLLALACPTNSKVPPAYWLT